MRKSKQLGFHILIHQRVKKNLVWLYAGLLCFFLIPSILLGQTGLNNPFTGDSLKPDSLSALTDSISAIADSINRSEGGIDTVVTYTCEDSIIYTFSTRTMMLYNKATIQYQQMSLKAEQIGVDWKTNVMDAEGVPDSTDTLHNGFRGTPVMKDGGEEYDGHKLAYNFKTKKGKIQLGETKIDEGIYHGEDIKKVDKDVMFVENGRYTTCDAPEPHYYFGSPKMKVTMHDQVIAEPVYLFIADVPVFALPFAVFPNKSGRRSGIIAPAYGEDGQRGKFLRHLGFYWAVNDYMDWKLTTDLYSRGGWGAESQVQYNLRYNFNGSLSGDYKKLHTGEDDDPTRTESESYTLSLRHNQDINPTTRLDIDFTVASDNSYLNTSDYDQSLKQSIASNATLSKRWDPQTSLTLNVHREQFLKEGNIYETLPSLTLSNGTIFPFRSKKAREGSTSLTWYEMVGVSYNLNASNTRSKTKITVDNVREDSAGHSIYKSVDEYQRGDAQRLGQGLGFSIAPKLGYITIAPSLSVSDSRNFSNTDIPQLDQTDSSVTFVNQKEAQRSSNFTSGVSINTRLFGIWQPNAFGVAAFRHTLTPSVSLTYDKEFIGDDTNEKRMFASMSIGNVFEMKTIPEEEGKEGKKIQLLNVGVGAAYDFTADSMKLSTIRMNFRTGIGNVFDINGGADFDPYKLDEVSPGKFVRVNKFLLGEGGGLARLTGFRMGISTSLSGEKKKSEQTGAKQDSTSKPLQLVGSRPLNSISDEPDFSIPWQLQLHWDFSQNITPPIITRSSNVRATLEFNLTEKWKFGMDGGYDLINSEVVYPHVTISRDLHCWLMNFSWTPIGQFRSYQFEIRVKASMLQDVKVTKSGSDRGIY